MKHLITLPNYTKMQLGKTVISNIARITTTTEVLHPIDKELYTLMFNNNLLKLQYAKVGNTKEVDSIDKVTYNLWGNRINHSDIMALASSNYKNERASIFDPTSVLNRLLKEGEEMWIHAGYNKKTNQCKCNENGIGLMTQVTSVAAKFNYYLGLIGNPSHFIIIKNKTVKSRINE